ncbi:hypothetical protein K474DRAFT_1677202 [Panus rudis PR-1116 ss-1]|nr:hypothetical protein K474DRAFT_1677202 [Panus rudis PR-1116 ss-1]
MPRDHTQLSGCSDRPIPHPYEWTRPVHKVVTHGITSDVLRYIGKIDANIPYWTYVEHRNFSIKALHCSYSSSENLVHEPSSGDEGFLDAEGPSTPFPFIFTKVHRIQFIVMVFTHFVSERKFDYENFIDNRSSVIKFEGKKHGELLGHRIPNWNTDNDEASNSGYDDNAVKPSQITRFTHFKFE